MIAHIAEDVNIRKSNVHSHRAEFAPLRVVVEAVANLMAPVTGAGAFFIHEGDFYLGFHDSVLVL